MVVVSSCLVDFVCCSLLLLLLFLTLGLFLFSVCPSSIELVSLEGIIDNKSLEVTCHLPYKTN